MFVRLARHREPQGTDQGLETLPESRLSPAIARAYLWVFVVTFPIHELSNEGLILVHLGQAHPAEGRATEAGAAVMPRSGLCLTLLASSSHKARLSYVPRVWVQLVKMKDLGLANLIPPRPEPGYPSSLLRLYTLASELLSSTCKRRPVTPTALPGTWPRPSEMARAKVLCKFKNIHTGTVLMTVKSSSFLPSTICPSTNPQAPGRREPDLPRGNGGRDNKSLLVSCEPSTSTCIKS